MPIPQDVEELLVTLSELGVEKEFLQEARQILGNKAEDIGEWIELAVVLRESNHYHSALATYDAAIRRFPESHILWSNRGYVLLVWELYEEALNNFSKALDIKPDYIHAIAFKAKAYERLHEFEKAVATYRKVLEFDPSHAKAWNSLGLCVQALGNEEEAIRCYGKSIELDPDFTDPLFNLAALYRNRQEFSEALPYVSRLLEIDPDDYQAEELRDEILEESKEPRDIRTRDTYEKRIDTISSGKRRSGWRDNLFKLDGSRCSDAEVIHEQGKIGLRLALLDDATYRRAEASDTRVNYPLKIFVSYKWGSTAENQWVTTLAGKLAERGWEVVFDRYRDETIDRSVEEFVSRIVDCRIFLAIATPEYVAHAINPRKSSWVFDEYQIAMSPNGRMYCIALAPKGRLLVPEGQGEVFRRSDTVDLTQFGIPAIIIQGSRNPRFDEIHAIPSDEDIDEFLDQHLTYNGPSLNQDEKSRIVEALDEFKSNAHDPESAVDHLRAMIGQYPFVYHAWVILVLKLTEAGKLSEAVDALEAGIREVHPWDARLVMEHERVDLLNQLGRPMEAVRGALQILETRPLDWVSHFYIGNRLDDINELWGARNHLLIACNDEYAAAEAFNTLGVVYLRLGFILRARQCFEAALQKDATFERAKRNFARTWEAEPSHDFANTLRIQGPGTGCTACPAIYPMTKDLPMLCAACGGRRPVDGTCPYCAHDGFVPWSDELSDSVTVRCPTCRIGTLVKKAQFSL